jgi:hypothetical protein
LCAKPTFVLCRQLDKGSDAKTELTTVYFEQLPGPTFVSTPMMQNNLWPGTKTFLTNFRDYQRAVEATATTGGAKCMSDVLLQQVKVMKAAGKQMEQQGPRRHIVKAALAGAAAFAVRAIFRGRRRK